MDEQTEFPALPREPAFGKNYSWKGKLVVCTKSPNCHGCVLLGDQDGTCLKTLCGAAWRTDKRFVKFIEVPNAN